MPGGGARAARRPLLIGLTGGIGSGKSSVAAMLASLGAAVVDADAIAREVVEPGEPALARLVEAFGPGILRPDGTLDRRALGRRVFGDDAARKALEGIVHPAVRKRTWDRIGALMAAGRHPAVVWDVPLLFEVGAEKLVARSGSSPPRAACAFSACGSGTPTSPRKSWNGAWRRRCPWRRRRPGLMW